MESLIEISCSPDLMCTPRRFRDSKVGIVFEWDRVKDGSVCVRWNSGSLVDIGRNTVIPDSECYQKRGHATEGWAAFRSRDFFETDGAYARHLRMSHLWKTGRALTEHTPGRVGTPFWFLERSNEW